MEDARVEADAVPTSEWIEAGDERYTGFRITELWAILIVDPEDNQETIAHVPDPQFGTLALFATDERRLESYLRPAFEDITRLRPEMKPRLVHFVAADE